MVLFGRVGGGGVRLLNAPSGRGAAVSPDGLLVTHKGPACAWALPQFPGNRGAASWEGRSQRADAAVCVCHAAQKGHVSTKAGLHMHTHPLLS